jgi:hypothetical protein
VETQTPFDLGYILGSVSGVVGLETVALGRLTVENQVFGTGSHCLSPIHIFNPSHHKALANKTFGLHLSDANVSGIMGLAFPIEASIPATSGRTLLENALSHFGDDSRFFALKLSKYSNASSLTFGSLDPDIDVDISQFSYTPVYPRSATLYDFWKLPLQEITIDSISLPLSPSKIVSSKTPLAVLDSGTTALLGPVADVDNLWKAIGVARKRPDGQWQVQCTRGVIVTFVLGDEQTKRKFALDPSDVAWEQGREGDWCYGGIQGNDGVRVNSR